MSSEQSRSPLPRDPRYWDRLARRIVADASGPLSVRRSREAPWYEPLARRAPWLVAASVTAILLMWLTLPAPLPTPAFRWMEREVAPPEVVGTLGGPMPPSVEVVMAQFRPATGGEGR